PKWPDWTRYRSSKVITSGGRQLLLIPSVVFAVARREPGAPRQRRPHTLTATISSREDRRRPRPLPRPPSRPTPHPPQPGPSDHAAAKADALLRATALR